MMNDPINFDQMFREFEGLDNDPLTEMLWRRPDGIADMVKKATDNPDRAESFLDMMESAAVLMALPTKREQWENLDLTGVSSDSRLYSLIMLNDPTTPLPQYDYNFLCGVDLPDARLSISKMDEALQRQMIIHENADEYFRRKAIEEMTIPDERRRLATAFVKMMIEEAEPFRGRILGGAFEMERIPLAFLDRLVRYDSIRLVIHPGGIRGSLVNGNQFSPWFWSPRRTSLFMKGAELGWALSVFGAGIWRDACVVRHEFVTERQQRSYQPGRRQPRSQKKRTILPRVIRHVAWAGDEERDRITRQAHSVTQHYRELPPGQQSGRRAADTAEQYGWPAPPPGFTFVRPHTRGMGAESEDTPPVRQIICRGLQIAKIALG